MKGIFNMSTFKNAAISQLTQTTNGMPAYKSTRSACVDLFFKIGASRGKDIVPAFIAAYNEDRDCAIRIALWARDIRSGAGERKLFYDIIKYLEHTDKDAAIAISRKIPLLGRWDDLFQFETSELKNYIFGLLKQGLEEKNGLAGKWTPRKGPIAVEFRKYLGYTPKQYRKTLVSLTKVVEQQMCANQWDDINYSHVPSKAHLIYKNAFGRHSDNYTLYLEELKNKTTDSKVKINAGAVYPYEVLKEILSRYYGYAFSTSHITQNTIDMVTEQWNALPNYIGDANILPLVDVSESMTAKAGKNTSVRCIDVSVSLGLYLADKNIGKFKDMFLTFSNVPELLVLTGNIIDKCRQIVTSKWEMNTNLQIALKKILKVAIDARVSENEMPKMLLILSDMQFDSAMSRDYRSLPALEMIKQEYNDAGYNIPQIVFWNLNAYDNVPVRYNDKGVALVSGFSPTILKSILSADLESFTPEGIMYKTIMNERYNY